MVLVTRAEVDAAETAAALARRGHRAVLAPVIAVRAKPWIAVERRPAAIVATSHHAFGGETVGAVGLDGPLYVVGCRTAEAARAAGFSDVRTGAGNAAALASLIASTLPQPGPIVYLAGRDRKRTLEDALQTAGYRVDVREVYAAEAAEAWCNPVVDALYAGAIGAALHYSRRSAETALRLARRHGVEAPFVKLAHACLSEDVAEPLVEAGAASVAVATQADEHHLLALLPAR